MKKIIILILFFTSITCIAQQKIIVGGGSQVDITGKKDKTDSVDNTGYSSNYKRNKVKDSLQTNIDLKLNIANPTATGLLTTPLVKITSGSPGAGKVLESDADGDATWVTPAGGGSAPTGATTVRFYSDFLVIPASGNVGDFVASVAGTGSSVLVITQPAAATNTFGVCRGNLGTTTSGRAGISNNNFSVLLMGLGTTTFLSRASLVNLSDATNTYTIWLGFSESTSAPNNGICFRYTHSVNSGKWQAVTVTGGGTTATDTGITPVAGTFNNFKIVVNADATSVAFYIDGALVATNTTNIPVGAGKGMFYEIMALRSAGTSTFNAWECDYMDTIITPTTTR